MNKIKSFSDILPRDTLTVVTDPSGKCPHCGHVDDDIGGTVEVLPHCTVEDAKCEKCGTTWTNYYAFVASVGAQPRDAGRTIAQLKAIYGDSHPVRHVNEWRDAVAQGKTQQSYWTWVWAMLNPMKPQVERMQVKADEEAPNKIEYAFRMVQHFHPEVTHVVFTAQGKWLYMGDDGEGPSFMADGINLDLLQEAADQAQHPSIHHFGAP